MALEGKRANGRGDSLKGTREELGHVAESRRWGEREGANRGGRAWRRGELMMGRMLVDDPPQART